MKKAIMFPVLAVLVIAGISHDSYASTPIAGTATKCTSFSNCTYAISNSNGTGWASTYACNISFLLPGESAATYGQPYQSQIVSQSGSLYNVTGSFVAIDSSSGKVVQGSTNATINMVRHCHNKGCTTTYTLVCGAIVFIPTDQDGTSASVTCNPSTFVARNSTTCTGTVADLATGSTGYPTGNITFSTPAGYYGTFSSGTCSLTNYNSDARTWVYVTPNDD